MQYCFLRYPNGKFKALTLSYDDGACYDKRLIEIADKYGISVTLNINSSSIDRENRLSTAEITELLKKGRHEIAAHGARHTALGKATAVAGIKEIIDCRDELERKFGRIIRGYAYADSGITSVTERTTKQEIKAYLQMLGVAYARSLNADNDKFALPDDFYEWIPTAKHKNPKLMEYLDSFLNLEMPNYTAQRTPRLFYMWGHSFEFEHDGNWELLEEFCKMAGGHEDIWYATNIEICDYVRAYQALIFNVERSMVYNPTDKEIWFEADKQLLSVKAGETVYIQK